MKIIYGSHIGAISHGSRNQVATNQNGVQVNISNQQRNQNRKRICRKVDGKKVPCLVINLPKILARRNRTQNGKSRIQVRKTRVGKNQLGKNLVRHLKIRTQLNRPQNGKIRTSGKTRTHRKRIRIQINQHQAQVQTK